MEESIHFVHVCVKRTRVKGRTRPGEQPIRGNMAEDHRHRDAAGRPEALTGHPPDAGSPVHIPEVALTQYLSAVLPHLDERQRRLLAGATAAMLGRGGDSAVARASGMARNTVAAGRKESVTAKVGAGERVRRQGAGRPPVQVSYPNLDTQLTRLLGQGDAPAGQPLDWTFWSTYELAGALGGQGYEISPGTVAQLLHAQGFQLNGSRLTTVYRRRDMEAQLGQVSRLAGQFLARSLPVVEVRVRSERPAAAGPASASPSGAAGPRPAWAALATETIRRWWLGTGRAQFPDRGRLLICSAGFGSDEDQLAEWEHAVTQLADQIDVELTILHLPPVTRRWRSAERQLTELLTIQRRGRAVTYEATIDLLSPAGSEPPSGRPLEDRPLEGQPGLGRSHHGWCYRAAPMRREQQAPARPATPAGQPDLVAATGPAEPAGPARPKGEDAGRPAGAKPAIPRVAKVAEMVAHDIARDISARRLQPGGRLPAIRPSKDRYHVSSSSVRESLRILEMLGVVSVRPGPHGGPVVRQVTTEDFALTSTFYHHILGVKVRDLLDARAALEPIVVRFVAQRQPPVVMRRLRWHLTGSDREDVPGWDWFTHRSPTASFHRALLETGNPILDLTVQSLQECWLAMKRQNPFPRDASHHDRDHIRIAQAILKGEDNDAEWLMRRHMDYCSVFARKHFADLMEQVIDWR